MIAIVAEALFLIIIISLSIETGMEIGHLISNYLEWVEDD